MCPVAPRLVCIWPRSPTRISPPQTTLFDGFRPVAFLETPLLGRLGPRISLDVVEPRTPVRGPQSVQRRVDASGGVNDTPLYFNPGATLSKARLLETRGLSYRSDPLYGVMRVITDEQIEGNA